MEECGYLVTYTGGDMAERGLESKLEGWVDLLADPIRNFCAELETCGLALLWWKIT